MSHLLKIAKMFQRKLVFASNVNLQHLNDVANAANALVLSKPLWMTASGGDPYAEAGVESALDKIHSLTQNIQRTVNMYGLNQSGYTGYLNNMDVAVNELSSVALKTNLDPSASNKIGATKAALSRATSNFVPIGIPAQKPVTVPTQVVTKDQARQQAQEDNVMEMPEQLVNKRDSGNSAYEDEAAGMSYDPDAIL